MEARLTTDGTHAPDSFFPSVPSVLSVVKFEMETLRERYERLCREPSDINEHLPILYDYGGCCDDVVEFGVRGGNSTTALLATGPRRLTSVDIHICPVIADLAPLAASVEFEFRLGDTREIAPIACDLLFIDTLHTYDQLRTELARHSDAVRHWILLHDTTTFGEYGEGGGAGLWSAVEEFLDAHRSPWRLARRWMNQNGLTLLERSA